MEDVTRIVVAAVAVAPFVLVLIGMATGRARVHPCCQPTASHEHRAPQQGDLDDDPQHLSGTDDNRHRTGPWVAAPHQPRREDLRHRDGQEVCTVTPREEPA